mmetsp:Transcript_763/g.1442  ORF Transcript_763/g.1442 Transcript_763/m.1442 type:complete len:608 (+) Transcript_763:41-1864(+)|eukprot:CAMPEP_0175129822 /NCGR_PEP_ID=MMETSP0087-20121206/5678_1 /TAXON_ID=136419 /ORGANISM="Unknown Unknown, Strain D1" /LENGTH=607 /DNA_ID=CAMNT_0016411999 /DNA_START=41 /DNA_END=1864 /DNA_ORIENTATION=+
MSVADIQSRFHQPHTDLTTDPTRMLLKQGEVHRKAKFKTVIRECFLFTDCFVFSAADKTDKTKLVMKQIVFLADSSVEQTKGKSNSLDLISPERRFTVQFQDQQERDEWLEVLLLAKSNLPSTESKTTSSQPNRKQSAATLHDAVARRLFDVVGEFMWKRDLAINEKDVDGNTPLHVAAISGSEDITRTLLEHGADLDALDKQGLTPLHVCTKEGNVELMATMLNGRKIDQVLDRNGQNVLFTALTAGKNRINESVDAAIALGCDIHAKNEDGTTLLHSVSCRDLPDSVKLLLDLGASVTEVCKSGRSALHHAAMSNSPGAVRVLLENGAGPNVRDHNMNTPLHLAPGLDVAELLLRSGGRTELKNIHDSTAVASFEADDVVMQQLADATNYFKQLTSKPTDHHDLRNKGDWVEDSASDCCLLCNDTFTFKRRRHHCRRCGFLVCSACSSKKYVAEEHGKEVEFRACDGCFNLLHGKYRQLVQSMVSADNTTALDDLKSSSSSDEEQDEARVARERREAKARKQAEEDNLRRERMRQLESANAEKRSQLKTESLASTKSTMAENKRMLIERGEHLKAMETKADDVENHAQSFASLCKQMNQKQKSRF